MFWQLLETTKMTASRDAQSKSQQPSFLRRYVTMFTRSSNLFISCIMLIVIGAVQQVTAVEMEAGTWTQKADMPTARSIAGSAVVDGKIYVIGGAPLPFQATAAVEEYNPATDTWTRRADMPTATQGVAAAAVDGIIYAIGGNTGLDTGDKDLSTVEAYDPATDTWTTKAEMPTARNVSAIAVVDRIIYVIGGIFGTPEDYQTGEDVAVLSTVEAYDPATDTWTTKADMPTARGYHHAACVVDGRIYVFGGATKYGDLSGDYSCVPTVEVYDPATDTWTQASDMPWARLGHTASVVDGKVYIIGGLDYEVVKLLEEGKIELDKMLELFSTVDVYNPATDTWTTAPDLPNGRRSPTAAVVEGKIYIIGGLWGPEGTKLTTVEEYAPVVQPVTAVDMEAGTWTQKADMPTGRAIAGSAVVDGKIYVVGGAHIPWGFTAVVEEYNPETDTWTRRADMPTARQGVVAAAVDGIIYAIGGWDGSRDAPTVEAYDPATDTWTKKADMPTARNVSAIAVVDEIIYVIGGIFGEVEDYQTQTEEDVAVLSTVEAYDPATDTWTTKAEMPTARGYYHDLSGDFSCVPTVEVYDPATDTWTQASDMPWARHGHTASVVDGKVYIIGGLDLSYFKLLEEGKIELDKILELFSTVDVYNPATDTWTTAPALPNGRTGPTAAVVEGKIYIIGGYWGPEVTILSTVEEYAPDLRDFSNVFFMSLQSGLNIISLPLEPRTPYTARSFAESLSATVVIKLDGVRQRFVGFTLDAPDDGFAVEGGKGYIVNMPESKVVAFTGAAWTNQPPVEASPSLAQTDGAWAFVVSGRLLDGSDDSLRKDGYLVTVRNTRTNAVATDVVRSRYFAAAFADLNRQNVVQTGDRLEVVVRNQAGEMVSDTVSYTVTADAILKAYLPLTLKNSEIPLKSLLLQNYPNPFNPETWIPYQIRESEEVVIRIYNSAGRLVRTLDLGQREAGFYLGRSRAAYWDGKNDSREPVSSGLYFYQLQAGDFSATRKMVIVK